MNFSDEQQYIINSCVKGENIIVDAVAGSGKTTTLLGIAQAEPNKKMLGVLFNKSLKEETRERASIKSLGQLEIHNYHALAKKYYDDTICNDSGITKMIRENTPPFRSLPRWERIIIDEVQDMNPLYFHLISKILQDLRNPEIRITVMGDRYQSIYAFLYADSRFLTNAPQIYSTVKGNWIKASLSTTYRCSSSICSFLNDSLLGYKRLVPADPTPTSPVNYIYGCPFEARKVVLTAILGYLSNGFTPEDIFILAPSVKMKLKETPLKMLENSLVDNNIPIYVPREDEVGNDSPSAGANSSDPSKGKLVITTFHQSKGLERKVVIIYNFDSSYYKIFNKDADPNGLTAELYVAITRAAKHLYVIHDKKNPVFNFASSLFRNHTQNYIKFMTSRGEILPKLPQQIDKDKPTFEKPRIFHASEITNYLTADVILDAISYLKIKTIKEPHCRIDLASYVQTAPGHCEVVSDINGIAIPAVYEWRKRKTMRIATVDEDTLRKDGPKFIERYHELQRLITKSDDPEISNVLEITNIFASITDGYHYKVAQIPNYKWLQNSDIEPCMKILDENLKSDDIQYEVILPEQTTATYSIIGRIDAYSEHSSTLWEIKCTDKLDHTHEIQLGVYAWMFSKQFPRRFNDISFRLLNIRTGECKQISAPAANLDSMMSFIIGEKMRSYTKMSDEEFNSKFSVKFDATIPLLKQLKITDTMKANKQPALFLDEDEIPVKKQKTTPVLSSKDAIQTTLPFLLTEATTTSTGTTGSQGNKIINEATIINARPKGRVIVFDLETNGLPECPAFGKYYDPQDLEKYKTSRIVQWSWSLHEADGTSIAEEDHVIKPNLAEYRILNTQFHGITEDIARVRGELFHEVLSKWESHLAQATTVVGHNVSFDKHVLLSELYRRNHTDAASTLMSKEWICTMDRAKTLCGLKARNKLKPPQLRELMHALGIKEELGRAFHNSKHDVYYTAKCYFAEQVLINPCPKMYDGQYKGKTYEEILVLDRNYSIYAAASCNVHKLYNSPIRKLANWVNDKAKTDLQLAEDIKIKMTEIRSLVSN